ncbi:exported hypothetical protein [Candidatus Sulfopaludibacter sp. SbA4]|nr:exported hypothetical protein [Candidatus Sulfopaludibacter sp. SbA4]
MRLNYWALLGCALAVGSSLRGQCYDLATTHMYEPDGRFREQWDKPSWDPADPKDANGNAHFDKKEYGKDALAFALFMGIVQKTPQGWLPFQRSREPKVYCDHSGPRGSLFCWMTPYQTPSAQATFNPNSHQTETWSLTGEGVLKYVMRGHAEDPYGGHGGGEAVATLDLETGRYSMVNRSHGKGQHGWAIKGGVDLWREYTFTALVKLSPTACPATLKPVSLDDLTRRPKRVDTEGLRPCAVKMKVKSGDSPASFEFLQNPMNGASAEGCVVVYEGPMPGDVRVAQVGGK